MYTVNRPVGLKESPERASFKVSCTRKHFTLPAVRILGLTSALNSSDFGVRVKGAQVEEASFSAV